MKCLCLYVDGGKGHYVPAKAVHDALIDLGVDCEFDEFFDYLDIRWMGRINKMFWRTMLKFPDLERRISKHNDSDSNGMEYAIRFANRHCQRMLQANLEDFRPDFIFATHPYASTIIAEMLSYAGIDIPVYYFATDVFSAPVASICDKLRGFLIATQEGMDVVGKMGQKPETIRLSPFPLQQSIAESPVLTKREARQKLGLDENRFTLQLNLGGEGIGSLSLLKGIIRHDLDMQIVIIGGIDKKERSRIEKIIRQNSRTTVHVPGFVNNVNDYLAASDIIAGRAGINTIVEAIYAHRPFLITELVYTVIPSADYIEKYKVGWNCSDNPEKALEVVKYYTENPLKLDDLDLAFGKVPIKYSAKDLAQLLIDDFRSI